MMKKLLNKKGSVLFLVVVVMSILIVAASATFYIVNNQQSSVNVRYSSEQSYQTAVSLCNAVSDFLDKQFDLIKSIDNDNDYKNTLAGKIISKDFPITSDEINLKEMGLENINDRAKIVIDNADVQGEPISGDNTRQYFKINVDVSVNNETTSISQIRFIEFGTADYFTRFLTCTGNRPEDAIVSSGSIYGEAYFENPFTKFKTGNTRVHRSMYVHGDLLDRAISYEPQGTLRCDLVVNGKFLIDGSGGSDLSFPYYFVGNDMETANSSGYGKIINANCKAIYVGENFYLRRECNGEKIFVNGNCYQQSNGSQNTTFYVNKDLYIGKIDNLSNLGTYYVNGDVYLLSSQQLNQIKKIVYSGNLYIDNVLQTSSPDMRIEKNSATVNGKINDGFISEYPNTSIASFSDIKPYVSQKTQVNSYQKWNAYNHLADLQIVEEINLDVPQKDESGKEKAYHTTNPNSDKIILHSYNNSAKTLLIDASLHNVYVLLDDPDTFKIKTGSTILTKGDYAVIFVLPDNTNFVMEDQTIISNINLLKEILNRSNSDDYDLLKGWIQSDVQKIKDEDMQKLIENVLDSNGILKNHSCNNNIFLVTNGVKNVIDLGKSSFFGYVYTPNGKLTVDGSNGGIAYFGGMIAGTYTYTNPSAALIFAQPYDYGNTYISKPNYNPYDIVKYLIAETGSDSSDSNIPIKNYGTIGYR